MVGIIRLGVVAIGVLLVSCAHTGKGPLRSPQSTQELIDGSDQILRQVRDERIFNHSTCASYIRDTTGYLYDLPSTHFTPKNESEIEELKKQGLRVVDNLFQTRLQIRKRFQEFETAGGVSGECLVAVRKSMVYLRFAEEMLSEWLMDQGVVNPDRHRFDPFMGGVPFTMVNPEFGTADIKAGDVFVVRGSSEVSATIARMADVETLISHLAMAAYGPDGKLYAIESLIQTGTRVVPWGEWVPEQIRDDARIALYRHRDSELAERAARMLFEKTSKGSIAYDFKMDDDNDALLYCAETVSYAFKMAAAGKRSLRVPKHRTTTRKFVGTGLLENFGITDKSGKAKMDIFSPNDIEVDPNFDWVADWRNWPLLRQTRMQDAVLSSLNSWIIERGYRYRAPMNIQVMAWMGKVVRYANLGYADVFPKNMPTGFLRMFLQIRAAARILQNNLYQKEKEFYARHGHSMTYKEMLAINEEYRKVDCEEARKRYPKYMLASGDFFSRMVSKLDPEKSPFHLFFNNGKQECE